MTEVFDLNEVEIAEVSGGGQGREQTWWEWLTGYDPGYNMGNNIKG